MIIGGAFIGTLILSLCFLASLIIAIGVFYGLGTDLFASTEDVWEGSFSIVASIIITIMGNSVRIELHTSDS